MLSISNLNQLMSPSDCSHINIQTIHFGVVAIELLPTEFPWCTVHTAIAEDPVRFREGSLNDCLSLSRCYRSAQNRGQPVDILIPYS